MPVSSKKTVSLKQNKASGTRQTRLRLSPEERIAQILDAAASEFARCGFQQTRVEDIATAAGLSKGGFYAHFQGKDAVFEALLAHDLSGESLDLQAHFSSLSSMSDIIDGVAELLTSGLENTRTAITFRLLLADGWRVPDVVQCWRSQHVDHIEGQLQALLQHCVQAGMCKQSVVVDSPKLLLSSIVHALVVHMCDPQSEDLDVATIRHNLKRLMRELLLLPTQQDDTGARV